MCAQIAIDFEHRSSPRSRASNAATRHLDAHARARSPHARFLLACNSRSKRPPSTIEQHFYRFIRLTFFASRSDEHRPICVTRINRVKTISSTAHFLDCILFCFISLLSPCFIETRGRAVYSRNSRVRARNERSLLLFFVNALAFCAAICKTRARAIVYSPKLLLS